jgi:hypothetical protein
MRKILFLGIALAGVVACDLIHDGGGGALLSVGDVGHDAGRWLADAGEALVDAGHAMNDAGDAVHDAGVIVERQNDAQAQEVSAPEIFEVDCDSRYEWRIDNPVSSNYQTEVRLYAELQLGTMPTAAWAMRCGREVSDKTYHCPDGFNCVGAKPPEPEDCETVPDLQVASSLRAQCGTASSSNTDPLRWIFKFQRVRFVVWR